MEKKCSKCGKLKSSEEFNWKDKSRGKQQYACKDCTRDETAKHFSENRRYYLDKAKRRKETLRKEFHRNVLRYLREHPCIDCGEDDPSCLQFDHVGEKTTCISLMAGNRMWKDILKEIGECEVRCANCHSKRTAKEFGWYTIGA